MGGYHRITDEEREKDPLGRFEIICEKYLQGPETVRQVILEMLDPEERQTFLVGCGLYHLFTDVTFYRAMKTAMGETIYEELKKKGESK